MTGSCSSTVVAPSAKWNGLHQHPAGRPALKASAQDLPAHRRGQQFLQKYMPETFDDYRHMDEDDLKALVGLFRAMGPRK